MKKIIYILHKIKVRPFSNHYQTRPQNHPVRLVQIGHLPIHSVPSPK